MNIKRPCILRKLSCALTIAAIGFFVTPLTLWAQDGEDPWTKLADMPTARYTVNLELIDGKIYAVGGTEGLNKLEVYGPDTDTWTPRADMATPRAWFGVGVVGGKLYAMGGTNVLRGMPSNSVEEYDPASDTWTRRGDMPIAIWLHSACVVNGRIYVFGGYPADTPTSTVFEFDPIADTWTRKADMPTARGGAGIGVVDGKIYVTGGINSGWTALSQVEMYDPATDTWTRKANMPRGNTGKIGVLNGKIYAFGGILQKGGTGQRTVYQYDVKADEWETYGDMPVNNVGFGVTSLNGALYIAGGSSGPYPYTSGILNNVWKFVPAPSVDPNDPDGDGITTEIELIHGLDPNVADADSDHDGDGVIASVEIFELGTMANNPDSDGDGLDDGVETNTSIFVSSTDTGTDPTNADSDGDGVSDGDEVAGGSNPLDAESLPGNWPDLIPLNVAGFEPEGITLGNRDDFFVGAFSYSTWFGQPFSTQSGAVYKGNLRTGEGGLLVQPTGTPIKGLSYDPRTDYLWVAKGMGAGNQGVIVYNATSGEEIANVTFEGDRSNNDILVTEDAVYCTESTSPVLYRIPLGTGGQLPAPLVVEDVSMNGFVMDPDPAKFNANGLVETADGSLIVVNITTGVLYHVDTTSGDATPISITGDEQLFTNGDGLHLDGNLLYICQNFSNKIGVVQLSEDFTEGRFVSNLTSPDLSVPTTITGHGDSIYAINTHFPEIAAGNHATLQTEVVRLSADGGDWSDVISLGIAGFEPEGITLGSGHDFFVGGFSFSTWFGQPFSTQSGAVYKGNLRTGEGGLLVEPTGTPIKGLSYDARTDYLWVAKGMGAGNQGVIVYNATSGEELANVTFEGDRSNNDIVVTEEAVYCTDSTSPVLYRIPLETGGHLPASPVVEDFPMNGFVMDPDPTSFNANGIVSSPDGTKLIVVNITTGVLYLVDAVSGDSNPITIAGDERIFTDGDGLYLNDQTLYICQNFSNKIAVVQLSEDLRQGTFLWNLESPNLDVPTTITGYGDSIYAINTHFSEIAAGNHATVQTEVVRLSNVGTPSIVASDIALEGSESIRIGFRSYAPTTMFDFFLETTEDLSGSWDEAAAAELVETPDGYYFQQPRSLAQKNAYFRIGVRTKGAN